MNIKTKNWKELLTDEPFTREDLITIQVINVFITFLFSSGDGVVFLFSSMTINEDVIFLVHVLQNPNALDSKVTLEFDHVKKGLKVDDEGQL